MAIAALRLAFSQLPSGSTPPLAAALFQVASPRSPATASVVVLSEAAVAAAAALQVAAGWWLPQGAAAKAVARAVFRGSEKTVLRCLPGDCPKSEEELGNRRSLMASAALALAARQQFSSSASTRCIAAAVGRVEWRSELCTPRPVSVRNASSQARADSPAQVAKRSSAALCVDTSVRVVEQLWPAQVEDLDARRRLSPRSFEARLRSSAALLYDLQQASAVSQIFARRAEQRGWPAAHAYLYEEAGSKLNLQERYEDSMRRLLLCDRLQRTLFGLQQGSLRGIDTSIAIRNGARSTARLQELPSEGFSTVASTLAGRIAGYISCAPPTRATAMSAAII